MPFLAHRPPSREFVVPEEVADGATVRCPRCEGRMRPRDGANQARHFMHIDNLGDDTTECEGLAGSLGESELHRKRKSLAVSGLRDYFADFDSKQSGLELEVDVTNGPSLHETRRADALLQLADPMVSPNRYWGAGVIIEVQHHHEDKDVAAVTADYLRAGYSVYWAHDGDFTTTALRTERFEQAFNERWPSAFAPYFTDSDTVLRRVDGVEFNPHEIVGTPWSFLDPRPDCDHGWHTGHMGNPFCLGCGTTTRRHETGRPMYKPIGT